LLIHFQWPLVVEEKIGSADAEQARADQHGRPLSAWQEYACRKFGSDCRIALAIQRAENPQGKCETYHYNSDGTLDWGYFQINTVHLKRPGLNLRDLLGCKSNIDFAYQLFQEKGGFTPWSTYNSGRYRQFLTQCFDVSRELQMITKKPKPELHFLLRKPRLHSAYVIRWKW
jgi:hypothetical protein